MNENNNNTNTNIKTNTNPSSSSSSIDATAMIPLVKFVPFHSRVDIPFWLQYCQMKLDTIRLNEQPIPLVVSFACNNAGSGNAGDSHHPYVICSENALQLPPPPPPPPQQQQIANERIGFHGYFIGYNTMESFQQIDKNQLLYDSFIPYFLPKKNQQQQHDIDDDHHHIDDILEDDDDSSIIASLTRVLVISFVDLKNHQIYYWFGFPTLLLQSNHILQVQQCSLGGTIRTHWTIDQCIVFGQQFHQFRQQQQQQLLLLQQEQQRQSSTGGVPPYFIYSKKKQCCYPLNKKTYQQLIVAVLVQQQQQQQQGIEGMEDILQNDLIFVFMDPTSTTPNTTSTTTTMNSTLMMGWTLRNYIAYLCFHWPLLQNHFVPIFSFRPKHLRRLPTPTTSTTTTNDDKTLVLQPNEWMDDSILLWIQIPKKENYQWDVEPVEQSSTALSSTSSSSLPIYKVVGWELNARNKPGPRSMNLRPLLDSKHLAIQATDLNLKLMKWRMIPDLNITLLQSIKVVLLGAGTLGCNVARTLLGWGIRNIQFFDYGHVNYSNPVRQSLFTLNDCHQDKVTTIPTSSTTSSGSSSSGGRPKAMAAAEALRTIVADANSEGIILSIPMPGHMETLTSLQSSVNTLDQCIQNADVIFLLTDTRESRWLPTVMAAAYNKPLINAALGLDSWLVMRHGGQPSAPLPSTQPPEQNDHDATTNTTTSTGTGTPTLPNHNQPQLGCYFCNDVVAPENSTRNRTLDQQCTVTRPGLAPIASSMAVELMVAMLHHPAGLHAPAPKNQSGIQAFSPTISHSTTTIASDDPSVSQQQHLQAAGQLGIIPHQIRGSLVSYTMMTPTVPAFRYCTACSYPVVQAYLQDKVNLVLQTCQSRDGTFLEDLSGLTVFRAEATEKMIDMDNDEEEWD